MEWKFTEENPLKVVTLCLGYDSQLMALRNIGIPYECVGWSEIDKYAIMAHNAVFPEIADRNLGDMTKIDWSNVADFDLLFYSTPCTDFSNAGKQAGGEFHRGTGFGRDFYTDVQKGFRRLVLTKNSLHLCSPSQWVRGDEDISARTYKEYPPSSDVLYMFLLFLY